MKKRRKDTRMKVDISSASHLPLSHSVADFDYFCYLNFSFFYRLFCHANLREFLERRAQCYGCKFFSLLKNMKKRGKFAIVLNELKPNNAS